MNRQKEVVERFELQWERFSKHKKIYGMDDKSTKQFLFSYASKPSKNDIVLDGGCGHGLYGKILSPMCKIYIGLDMATLKYAKLRIKSLSNARLVQGDILHIPLKNNSVDYVFSHGVIHHTPNPRKAFSELVRISRKSLSIWVYPKESFFLENINNFVRYFTTRLPPKILFYFSYFFVPLLLIKKPYGQNRVGGNSWKELMQTVYDWLSPYYQFHYGSDNIKKWFEDEGFNNIKIGNRPTGVSGLKVK